MGAFLSTTQQKNVDKALTASSKSFMETVREYRTQIHMNSQTRHTVFSDSRWQRNALALAVCARVCMPLASTPKFTKHIAEVISLSAVAAKKLVANLRKHLAISVVCSAMAIRVRRMIT